MTHIKVTPTGYSINNQPEVATSTPLATAMRKAGDFADPTLIAIHGSHLTGLDIGGPAGYQNKSNCVFWDRPITSLTLSGVDSNSKIGNLRFWDTLNGVDSITIQNLTLVNDQNEFAPIRTAMNEVHGHITINKCNFVGTGTNWLGKGMKWGVRGHGPAKWTITDCNFDPCQEHSIYIDNPQGDLLIDKCSGIRNGRTFMQITNRPTSGPSQFGNISVKNCVANEMSDYGGGGSDYTFVGCTGKLEVKDCSSFNTKNGAMVLWTDVTNGTYVVGRNYSFNEVLIERFRAESSTATRPMISLSGIRYGLVKDCYLYGGPMSYRLGGTYGGPRPNGHIEIV